MNAECVAQLVPGIQLVVMHVGAMDSAMVWAGEWPIGKSVCTNVFKHEEARVEVDDNPPTLWLAGTNYKLTWLELLKVADFLRLDIPLPHPPEGTAVQP